MRLTDTHCHLDHPQFDLDRAAVLERARLAGVERILVPGTNLESSRAALRLADTVPEVFAAVGLHPTESEPAGMDWLEELRLLARQPRVRAIGEIGLDYYWKTTPHDLQRTRLEQQLELAAEAALPVVIHFREKGDVEDGPCAADLLSILAQWCAALRRSASPLAQHPGVLHSFSGSRETARQALELNFFLGVGGPVTYRRSRQELVADLPLERLLIETDAPYLAPAPQRGKRNEPAFTALIADKIAECHALPAEEIAVRTCLHANELFGWE